MCLFHLGIINQVTMVTSSALIGRTSGSRKLLMVLLLKPLGWEIPSSYCEGSQRVKGVLEAPRRGLFLQPNRRSSPSGTLLEKRWAAVVQDRFKSVSLTGCCRCW